MFKSEIENDKYGNSQTKFYLTQGDSCTIYSTPKRDGQAISLSLISEVKFKLSDSNYKQEFVKQLVADTVNNKYILNLTSAETTLFDIATHIYEIEYTFVDGAVETTNQWKFQVINQIEV